MTSARAGARPTVHAVLPDNVDDAAAASGGNVYDRRLCHGLATAGWSMAEIPVPGSWPVPGAHGRAALLDALAAVPDGGVVLLDGLVACAAPEVVCPQARRLRLVVLVHLPLADETGLAPGAAGELDAWERRTLHSATAVVVTSRWAARRLCARHRMPTGRVHVAVPGVDPAPTAGADARPDGPADPAGAGGPRLLCVACVTPRKGHDVLVEALARLADRPWSCVCVGALDRSPGYAADVRRAVGYHRLDHRLRLPGPLGGDALAAAYGGADLLVLPSRAETYGMVVTEALAHGVPVVASAAGGVPEALGRAPDGSRPGMLVPPGDPDTLATSLGRWLDDPRTRARLRRAARDRRAGLPAWPATVRAVQAVLARLTRDRDPA